MQRPERERKEPTEFNVIVKAKDLVKHTFTITNSTERYPKKYRKRRGDPQGAPQKQKQYEAEVEEISRPSRGGTDRHKDRRTILSKLERTRRKGK